MPPVRGKGQYLYRVSEGGKECGDCDMLETLEKIQEFLGKLYQKAKQETAKACGRR
jgi:hypothetical protein